MGDIQRDLMDLRDEAINAGYEESAKTILSAVSSIEKLEAKVQELEAVIEGFERIIDVAMPSKNHKKALNKIKADAIEEMLYSGELVEAEGVYLGADSFVPTMIAKKSIIDYIAKLREDEDE